MVPQDLIGYAVLFLPFIVTIVATWIAARFLSSLMRRRLRTSPPLLVSHAGRLVWFSAWLVGGLFALGQLGLRLDILLLIVGLLGAAMVLGVRDVLQNLAARYFHELYVPFKVGDTIRVRDYSGKVIEINPIATVLLSEGKDLVSVPNATFLRETVVNTTPHAWQEVVVAIEIGNNVDIAEFEKQVILSCNKLKAHLDERFPPVLSIKQRGEKSIELQLTLMMRDPEKRDAIISEVTLRVSEIKTSLGQPKKN